MSLTVVVRKSWTASYQIHYLLDWNVEKIHYKKSLKLYEWQSSRHKCKSGAIENALNAYGRVMKKQLDFLDRVKSLQFYEEVMDLNWHLRSLDIRSQQLDIHYLDRLTASRGHRLARHMNHLVWAANMNLVVRLMLNLHKLMTKSAK